MTNKELITSKIFVDKTDPELQRKLAFYKFKNKKIVFTNGCFDILHQGHVDYLSAAANNGDILVLGLNTDASVKRLKGESRPVNDQMARAKILASLFFIDLVILFDEDTPLNLIETVKPDILIKGADYKPENIVGYDFVVSNGGKVITIDLTEGFSTTKTIEKLSQVK